MAEQTAVVSLPTPFLELLENDRKRYVNANCIVEVFENAENPSQTGVLLVTGRVLWVEMPYNQVVAGIHYAFNNGG